MSIWYIKKMDSQEELSLVKKIFIIPEIKQIQNNYIVVLPIKKDMSRNYQNIVNKKILKKLYDNKNQKIVLSRDLYMLKEELQEKVNILDGRWMFKYLSYQIIEYVSNMKKIEIQELEVAIMVNDNSENILKMLIKIASKIKMLNIVTNDIDRFKGIEEYLFKNMGIVIRTTNNRKKALIKSNLIINLDFPPELLNSYFIPTDATIINTKEKINIKSKRFAGINCNSYKISLPKEKEDWFKANGLLEGFDSNILLESIVQSKKTYESIEKELNESKIDYLIGNNGKIRNEEYKKI